MSGNESRSLLELLNLSSKSEPSLPNFVLPPNLREFKWRDDIFVDRAKKRMSVEIQRHAHFGSLDPDLYPTDYIPECDEITDDYLPDACRGRLWLKFAYDSHEECLAVGLVKIRFVPRRVDDTAPDIVFAFTVMPTERRHFQSRVYDATTDRDFDGDEECFVFQVPKAPANDWALKVRLYDSAKQRNSTPIGAAIVPLAPIIAVLNNNEDETSLNSREGSPTTACPPSPRHSNNTAITVRCIDLQQPSGENGDVICIAKTTSDRPGTPSGSTPPAGSSPASSAKLVRKLFAINAALQQQLAINSKPHHTHHQGIMQLSFCYSESANRLSISVHDLVFTCPANNGADRAAIDEDHNSVEAFARLSLLEHGTKELKSKRTRTVKAEKMTSKPMLRGGNFNRHNGAANESVDIEHNEHSIRFIELVVFKDLPTVEHLINNCGLRIQVIKTSLVSRDKPICRTFIGSAIFCRGKELQMWEDILTNKLGEPLAFQLRMNAVFDAD